MNRKQRAITGLVIFWTLCLGVPGIWLWREDRQQRLNLELIAAVKQEDVPRAVAALKLGADANTRDERGIMPSWLRIWNLLQGRRPPPPSDRTPLLILLQNHDVVTDSRSAYVRKERPDLVALLLAHGARVDVVDVYGRTPLFYALFETKPVTARLLVDHGASVTVKPDNESLLLAAIRFNNDASIVELLLQHGADANRANRSGLAPLDLAILRRDAPIVAALLRHRVNSNHSSFYLANQRPVDYAEHHNLTEIATLLKRVTETK